MKFIGELLASLLKKLCHKNEEKLELLEEGLGIETGDSGCFSLAHPLPADHWLFDDKPMIGIPQFGNLSKQAYANIERSIKVGIRQATDNGRIVDYDPDLLVDCILKNIVAGDINEAQLASYMAAVEETEFLGRGQSPVFVLIDKAPSQITPADVVADVVAGVAVAAVVDAAIEDVVEETMDGQYPDSNDNDENGYNG